MTMGKWKVRVVNDRGRHAFEVVSPNGVVCAQSKRTWRLPSEATRAATPIAKALGVAVVTD
jgi:hypothetical protein